MNLNLHFVISLGEAWASNSVNCVPFRQAPLLFEDGYDITGYYDPHGQIVIARVSDNSVFRTTIANDRLPFDAHQSISLGSDLAGRIHVAFGAHDSPLLLCRSNARGLQKGFSAVAPFVPCRADTHESSPPLNVTYPMFVRTVGECLLICRYGSSSDGAIHVSRQGASGTEWHEDTTAIVSGRTCVPKSGPYLNTPIVSPDGIITCFMVWRLPADATSGGMVVNSGIDCFRSSDGLRTITTFSGLKLPGGATPACSERVVAVPLGANLINQASAARMPSGQVAVISYWSGADGIPQFNMAWPDVAGWRVSQVSDFTTPFALSGGGTLPVPHSRPELLFDDDGRAYVIYRSVEQLNQLMVRILEPPAYERYNAVDMVLVAEDLGFYEPIVSRAAWAAERRLVAFVQHCNQQASHDGVQEYAAAPARLYSWRLTSMDGRSKCRFQLPEQR